MIYFTSDFHFNHNREFVWEKRGYKNIDEMNKDLLQKYNSKVSSKDEVYILGDVALANRNKAIGLLGALNGHKHLIIGNHDPDSALKVYRQNGIFESISAGERLTVLKKKELYLSHFPFVFEGNHILNFHGHTHSTDRFNSGKGHLDVGIDANDGFPVSLDEALEFIQEYNSKC